MLKKGANVNEKNNQGETPLHEAAFRGNKNTVLFFVKYSTADVNITNKYVSTYHSSFDISLSINNCSKMRSMGETPLHYAIRAGKKHVVHLLVSLIPVYFF